MNESTARGLAVPFAGKGKQKAHDKLAAALRDIYVGETLVADELFAEGDLGGVHRKLAGQGNVFRSSFPQSFKRCPPLCASSGESLSPLPPTDADNKKKEGPKTFLNITQ